MEYQEFISAVEKQMNVRLQGGVKASHYKTMKNNGKIREGILLEEKSINISPTIYLEEFYERFREGIQMEQIIGDILDFYDEVRCEHSLNVEEFSDYPKMREKIVFKLIQETSNRELLKEVPHIHVLDLCMVFYALLDVNSCGTATMMITKDHMQDWQIGKEELYRVACENGKRLLSPQLLTMQQTVEEVMRPLEEPLTREWGAEGKPADPFQLRKGMKVEKDAMYVLTNRIRAMGAACMAYPGALETVGEVLKENYYILPSSIHEVILVPESESIGVKEMNEMVQEINRTQVEQEEVLSDHVYFYDRKLKRLKM